MLFKSVKSQMGIMLKQTSTWITFYILLGFVLYNYWNTFPIYQGYDVIYIPHPARLSFLASANVVNGNALFFQLYPLLVILPAGFSLIKDYESKICVFMYAKVGGMNYYMGKLIASFLVPFLVFSIPLLIELGMNFFIYPDKAIVNCFSSLGIYSENLISEHERYLGGRWEADYPYIATILAILRLGIVSGVLNMFTVSLSTPKIQLKVLLFLPVYILLYGLAMLDFQSDFTISCINYLYVFFPYQKWNIGFLVGLLVVLAMISIIIMYRNGKKEMLI